MRRILLIIATLAVSTLAMNSKEDIKQRILDNQQDFLHQMVGAENSAALNVMLNLFRPYWAYPELTLNGLVQGLTFFNYRSPLYCFRNGMTALNAWWALQGDYYTNGMSDDISVQIQDTWYTLDNNCAFMNSAIVSGGIFYLTDYISDIMLDADTQLIGFLVYPYFAYQLYWDFSYSAVWYTLWTSHFDFFNTGFTLGRVSNMALNAMSVYMIAKDTWDMPWI